MWSWRIWLLGIVLICGSGCSVTVAQSPETAPSSRTKRERNITMYVNGHPVKQREFPSTGWLVLLENTANRREWRKTAEAAEKGVVEKACAEVGAWLRKQYPASRWQPDEEFLRRFKMIKSGPTAKAETRVETGDGDAETLFSASLELDLSTNAQREMHAIGAAHETAAHHQLAWSRQWSVGKAQAMVMVLLLALLGYVHAEDRTKGYYTRTLQLIVAAVVIVAGVGISLIPAPM